MNCKPGDLAVIVRPYKIIEEIGRPVRVVRLGIDGELGTSRDGCPTSNIGPGGPGWLCEANDSGYPCFIGDAFLRPIRGQDGEDEILRLVGRPEGVAA